jgi:hypothetical protein
MRERVLRIDHDRPPQQLRSGFMSPALSLQHSQQLQCIGLIGLLGQHRAIAVLGFCDLAAMVKLEPRHDQLGEWRLQAAGLLCGRYLRGTLHHQPLSASVPLFYHTRMIRLSVHLRGATSAFRWKRQLTVSKKTPGRRGPKMRQPARKQTSLGGCFFPLR